MSSAPDTGFNYIPGWTMAGVLYNGEDGQPHISNRFGETHNFPVPQGIGRTIKVCSSSHGLVAYYNLISNIYSICNPEFPYSCNVLPKPPRQHDALSTHVVLAVGFLAPPAYHLICATQVNVNPIRYNFDTYTSLFARWSSCEGIDVGGLIDRNTGISCDIFAYWLTVGPPRSVIRFDVYNPLQRWQSSPVNVSNAVLGTRFQLGRVRNQLGLISVTNSSNPTITLYLLQEEGFPVQWQIYSYVVTNFTPNMLPLSLIRFESFKLEVCFWANGRLMIGEASIVEPQRLRVRCLDAVGACAADGFAWIYSKCLPTLFPLSLMN